MLGNKKRVNKILKAIDVSFPIIQAPMAGVAGEQLAAAVSNAGGLGSLGAGYMSASQLSETINKIRNLTTKAFAINLFIPPTLKNIDNEKIHNMQNRLKKYRDFFNLDMSNDFLKDVHQLFLEQVEVLIHEKIPVFSFTFGIPNPEIIQRFKMNGTYIMGTATTVAEALCLQEAHCDLIAAQGIEAGGHRGSFLHSFESSQVGTLALVPQIVDAVNLPVFAAGGIMDGRGIVASLALGATGVQMGTAFLTCQDSGVNEFYKKMILASTEESTQITKVYSGKPVRGITNKFMQEMQDYENELLDYPVQHYLTQGIRKLAAEQCNSDYMSMWAGQGTRLNRTLTVNHLMQSLIKETQDVIKNLSLLQ
jgi:nitronate monooxygenase